MNGLFMNGLLKFIACGSVDDGKSTLIGRILYDAKLLYADQEQALLLDSQLGSRGGKIDYSLLLDGLMAEREQGITIDVAYRYFTTDARSFIVADTPGHEEYTRNMAVGAAFADLAVILVDAVKGVLRQTRRHARICALMGIKFFVFAVNKMDLTEYDKSLFEGIQADIFALRDELSLKNAAVIPLSATEGDNVTQRSERVAWYDGPTLLSYLENVDVSDDVFETGFYLPVQRVCRPDQSFRGFQGQVESGAVQVGDVVTILPGGENAVVKSIYVVDQVNRNISEAATGQPVTLQLDREVDVSRGWVLERGAKLSVGRNFVASLLWMDDNELTPGKEGIYWAKIGTRLLPCAVEKILHKTDVNSGESLPASSLYKNEIGLCDVALSHPAVFDVFKAHKTLGELILIDRVTHSTAACGVIEAIGESHELKKCELKKRELEKCELEKKSDGPMKFNTLLLHGFQKSFAGGPSVTDGDAGATLPPIYQNSAFAYESAEILGRVFDNKAPGFVYTQINNPTISAFEQRMAFIEGGASAVACASGMAAISMTLLNILQSGDEIISSNALFGGTLDLFGDLEHFGIHTRFVEDMTGQGVESNITEKTKVVLTELISNPKLNVVNVRELASVTNRRGIPLIIDSTTATPALIRPLEEGADIVVHSSSKYINGNGSAIGGVIIDGGKFEWDFAKFPVLQKYGKMGKLVFTARLQQDIWRNFGSCMSPQHAYLNCLGLETLGLRMERLCANALALAKSLERNPDIANVNYPGLDGSPDKINVDRQMKEGRGGALLTLRAGSRKRAFRLLDNLQYARIATNIGDVRTLVIHPASTIYAHFTEEQKRAASVYDDLIRVSVGLENAEDLIDDFAQAAAQANRDE